MSTDLHPGQYLNLRFKYLIFAALEFTTMKRDKLIFDLITKENQRQEHGIELIASENFASPQTIRAMGTVLTNKYAEGLPGKRYYGGCEVVDEIEQIAIDRLKELFGAEWANVQPHSGAQANAAVLLACIKAGDKILGFNLSHGGHLTHGSPVNFSGKLYQPVFYGVEQETGRIDFDKVKETALREKPKLIICGASAYSRARTDADCRRPCAAAPNLPPRAAPPSPRIRRLLPHSCARPIRHSAGAEHRVPSPRAPQLPPTLPPAAATSNPAR